jgi:hypothetical protein
VHVPPSVVILRKINWRARFRLSWEG